MILSGNIFAGTLLEKTHERAGVNLQYCRISPKIGDAVSYTALSFPITARVQTSRYLKIAAKLNQGYQSYDGNGLYGFSDLEIGGSYLMENYTIIGGIRLPMGTKDLSSKEFTSVSAGRLPYINSSLVYAGSGFGFHSGISYGMEMSSNLSLALGAIYFFKGAYDPIKGINDFNPSDEFRLAAGMDYKKGDFRFFGKTVISFYTNEKYEDDYSNNYKVEPGAGFNFAGNFTWSDWHLETILSKRGESKSKWGGDFEPPSLLSLKVSYDNVWDYAAVLEEHSIMPYIGFEKTGKGSMTKEATQFLLGCYLQNFSYKGFPGIPFLELNFGTVSGDASLLGFKIGVDFDFQIYK